MTLNHLIPPDSQLQLALIEGTEVEALCGHRFTPTLTVGSSGRADVPGAAWCDACDQTAELRKKYELLAELRTNLRENMNAIEERISLIQIEKSLQKEVTA
ncbi:hypothetical protein [Microbacterium sp. YY-01]|uniref:hypothetical protein n=1 Tax=Microbacterium sp. YY-01 TaxID=3421634 RepID=UPI003D16D8C5